MSEDKTMHFCETIEAVPPATDELRRLLDECGIEYCDYYNSLTYFRLIPDVEDDFFTTVEETRTHRLILKVGFKSPKQAVDAIQAIATTLGPGTCRIEHYDTDVLLGEDYYRCTACHSEIFHNLGYRFCPYCGAKVVADE